MRQRTTDCRRRIGAGTLDDLRALLGGARLAAPVIALLLAVSAGAQSLPTVDQHTGAVVLPGVLDAMRSHPSDRLRIPATGNSKISSSFSGPWMTLGARAARQSLRSSLATLQGTDHSVVIMPVTGTVRWTWTNSREVARITADPRSRSMTAALGYRDIKTMLAARSGRAQADRLVVAMFARSAADAAIPEVNRVFGRAPILVIEVPDGRNPGPASTLIEAAVSGRARTIALPGRKSDAAALSAAVGAFKSRKAAVLAATKVPSAADSPSTPTSAPFPAATTSVGNQAPAVASAGSAVSAPGAQYTAPTGSPPAAARAPVANWSSDGSAWTASLPDGTAITEAWNPAARAYHADLVTRLAPVTEVKAIAGGIRVTYTYENRSAAPIQLSSMALPTLVLGPSVTVQDTRYVGGAVEMTADSPHWRGTYPGILYAPAVVVRNTDVAVGISVEYPVMEYRHDIRLRFRGEAGGRWIFELGMENSTAHCGFSRLLNMPVLMPGELRTYRINVVTAAPDQWIGTLAPYRDYFTSHYGSVGYSRDGRPIAGLALSSREQQSATNPSGWRPGIDEREGFASAARIVEDRFLNCSDRVMLWAPTGYSPNERANYPFQFASRWTEPINGAPSPMSEAPEMLTALASVQGRTLGMWWGHAANPSSGWADDPDRPLRLSDAAGCTRWFAELDTAVACGATEIGLDAFVHHITPVWEQRQFLVEARRRHPGIRFCIEERTCDILHTMAATWVDGYRIEQIFGLPVPVVSEPFTIAEFLVPGQETWVGMQFDRSRESALWGLSSTIGAQRAEIQKVAGLGYVPVNWVPMQMKSQSFQ